MARTFLDEGTDVRAWKEGGTPALPANWDAITPTEYATGKTIAAQLVVGSSTFEFADPDTVDEKSYADKGKSQTPTTENANVEMTMFGDRTNGTLSTDDPRKVFATREVWYFVVRPGVPQDTTGAAGQDYTYYKRLISVINDLSAPDGGTEKVNIKTLPAGDQGRGVITA